MTKPKIIIQVEDKQLMIEAARAALVEGEKFGKQLFHTLIDEWGADRYKIDQGALIEMGTGHLVDCCIRGVTPTPHREYIADRLSAFSDTGLKKMGLTRAQYIKASRGEAQ